jgi:hypothetical protein
MRIRYSAVLCLTVLAFASGCNRQSPADEAASSTASAPPEVSSAPPDQTSSPAPQSSPQ